MSLNKILDIVILVLIIVFSVGYFNIHHDQFGLHEKLFPMQPEIEQHWDILLWIIFSLMAFDVYLKYKKVGNLKLFLKKHWLDVLMLVLIPIFSTLKIVKFSLKMIKTLKMTKSGFKVVHLTKKIFKSVLHKKHDN